MLRYIDHKNMTPQWKSLQAETEISLADIRRGGYRTVANAVQKIRDAFDQKKVALLLSAMDGVVISGGANYINETGSAPTAASMDKRTAIIDFASYVIDEKKSVTREQFNRIFKLHKEYEQLIEANNLTNGEVDIAIRIIKESYENHMRSHTFVENLRGYD